MPTRSMKGSAGQYRLCSGNGPNACQKDAGDAGQRYEQVQGIGAITVGADDADTETEPNQNECDKNDERQA